MSRKIYYKTNKVNCSVYVNSYEAIVYFTYKCEMFLCTLQPAGLPFLDTANNKYAFECSGVSHRGQTRRPPIIFAFLLF